MDSSLIYTAAIAILFLTLAIMCCWYYARFVVAYSEFPSYSLTLRVICCILRRKCPRHIPLSSFFFQELMAVCKQYQSEGVCLVWLFRPYLFVFGEESIKTLTYEPEAIYKPVLINVFSEFLGAGLVTRNGDTWKATRKMFNPFFHLRVLKNNMCIYNKHATLLVERLAKVTDASSIDMADFLPYSTIRIIFESLTHLNSEAYSSDIEELHEYVEKLTAFTTYRIFHPYLFSKWMLKLFPIGRKYLKYYEAVDNIPKKIIMEMKNFLENSQTTDTLDEEHLEKEHISKSLLQVLIEVHMKDPNFTIDTVLDEFKNFLFAGYDTVTYTLMWCIFMLGIHPEVQEQLHNEVGNLPNVNVTYDNLSLLTYLDCVIKETLRLYPTVPIYVRRINKDKKCGMYNIPSGTELVHVPYVYHRNCELYPDPERFDPDRFRKENLNNRPWTYVPFAEGIRNCIGKNFALMEMKVILVHIVRKLKISSLDRREDVDLDWAIVLKGVRPLRIKLSLR